jgi:predicted enzyme related to lactoylglutathione lyase
LVSILPRVVRLTVTNTSNGRNQMADPVVHFEVSGKDPAALTAFYSDLFGWKTNVMEGMGYTIVEKEEGGIGGGIGQAQDGAAGHVTFYVAVDDPQAALDKAVALGGTVVMPVDTIPNMVTLALFKDPEGNMVGIVGSETPTE